MAKKLSTRERIIELFDNAKMTVKASNGKDVFGFNDLLKSYEEKSGTTGTTLAKAVSTMISEDRKPSDYYSLSPAVFDSKGNSQSKDGYNVRMSLCEKTAWEIINNSEITTMQKVEDFMQEKSEELRNEYYKQHNLEIDKSKENVKTISWNEIQEAADGAYWNDDALAVKNKAREQAAEFANEIGAELNADDEDDIESFVQNYGISFQPDGTMSENCYVLPFGNPQFGHDYGVQDMLAKYLEEESEKNASDNKGKEFASNFSRERFADGDLRTIIQYANHIDDGSAQWMLGAKAGGERQLYYRDQIQSGEWQKATVQEFFDFVGDFYAHNYDVKNELDENSLSIMSQLFPNSKEIDKLWQQHFTKNDMQLEDVNDLSDHSAHGEIWSHLPDIDDGDNPYVVLENAVEAAASYLENNDGLKDKDFGNRSDSTEEEKATRKEFLSLLKDVNDALHSDEFHDNAFPIENATAENLDLLHAEVLKDCAALAKEDFLSSFGEIIDGEYPNQEEAEYRRHTLNELRIDEKNLDNYLDDNAPRLLENVYEKVRTKSVGLYGFIEATVDTSDPAAEQEMEWNRALKELLDGYTDYKDFNEEWDVSLTPATAKLDWLESEKDLIHIAFDNALGNDSVEVPAGAESYKDFLDSIDFEKRFSHSNLLRAETLQMNNEKLQKKNINENKDIERFSVVFAGMEAPDLQGKLKDIEGLIENYRNTEGVKVPVADAISTMLYDSPQIHENGSYSNFGALSMENFDNKYEQDGTDARNELCDMVAVRIVADKSIKSFDQVKELMKTGSVKIAKEKLEEKNMEKEDTFKISDAEMARLSKLFEGKTCLDSAGTKEVDFKDLVEDYKNNKQPEDVLKDAVATMIHENREADGYYNFSPSDFDFKSSIRDADGYEMRWELCEKTAEQVIRDKTAKTMDDAETIMSWVSADMIKEYESKEKEREQDSPDIATWQQLKELVGIRDFDSVKDDALMGNPGFGEREWKEETLARCLEDGILDLREFTTSSGSKINDLQFDPEFTKSSKWGLYEKIEPEKWRIIDGLSKDIVAGREALDNGDIGLGDIQSKYDDMLSESDVYLEAVENGLVEIDKSMAEIILDNNNPHTLQDGVKIAIVKASFEKDTPEWEKPERFIVTPHNSFPENYTDKELSDYLTDNRVNSAEPKISEKQAGIISYYLMRNEYALYVDQKGNLNCVDFSEDFNLDDVGKVITNNELLKLTNDLIDKDIGFKNRAEEDFKEIKNLLNGYEKEQKIQKTQSPQELYDSFIGKVEKEFKELKLLRAATVNVIKELSQEDKSIINSELKKRGAKTPESLALIVKESIEKRNKNKTKEYFQKREKDYFERER